jgi:hypothetical protein
MFKVSASTFLAFYMFAVLVTAQSSSLHGNDSGRPPMQMNGDSMVTGGNGHSEGGNEGINGYEGGKRRRDDNNHGGQVGSGNHTRDGMGPSPMFMDDADISSLFVPTRCTANEADPVCAIPRHRRGGGRGGGSGEDNMVDGGRGDGMDSNDDASDIMMLKKRETDVAGIWVCRTHYHPVTGAKKSFSACIGGDDGLESDVCGCCNDKCPRPYNCTCTTHRGTDGVWISMTARTGRGGNSDSAGGTFDIATETVCNEAAVAMTMLGRDSDHVECVMKCPVA